jgi:hypothetical protein
VPALALDHPHLTTSSRRPLQALSDPTYIVAGFTTYRILAADLPEHLVYASGSNYPSRPGRGAADLPPCVRYRRMS